MDYAKIKTPTRTARIYLEPTGFGKSFQELFNQTDVSGYEVWLLESYNNFQNPFAKASEAKYDEMGPWKEIFRDKIVESFGIDDKGRLKVKYVSHAGTEWEKEHTVRFPKDGFYVPTKDGIFVPGTLVPFRTVETKKKAIKEWEKAGLDPSYVSRSYRLDNYRNNPMVVTRSFCTLFDDGCFFVDAGSLPCDLSYDLYYDNNVASRKKFEEQKAVMQVTAL